MNENNLVTKDHFADLRTQIIKIKEENSKIVFDYEKEEKAARSYVQTMRKSKTAISNLHKEKKKFFLEEGRKIDAAKNELIAEVDEMIEVHAKPLQEIKDRKEAAEEVERLKVIFDLDYEEALSIDDLFNREREMARKEAEFKRIEDEKKAKEEAGRLAKEQAEREERLKKEAAEKAVKDAEEKILFEQQEKERLIQEAKDREAQAIFSAKNAERIRLEEIEEANQKAEQEKNEALAQQKREQEEKEQLEKKRIADKKEIADRKAANLNHVKAVNNRVLKKLVACGISEDTAKDVIKDILTNKIIEITINY